jgi:ribonuclease P protein component
MQTESVEARVSASLLLHPRVGIVVPRYRHSVVRRNRIKRHLRELARIRLLPNLGSVDLLLRAKPAAYTTSFEQLASDVDAIAGWVRTIGLRS